ncbi:MAG: glycerol-3-phosphate 1-O-acyltransferase PlsY [Gloeomargarita sp. SKYG116]|nr:glycerol-3-phosphate 1-O-acyltransferase PlsY [Gloeomargarita sp. SKYG116]MDW8400218.1 glycerol-3-phosphate 1-O-acyltransferase PlsY [Gloeomargarita sp. SKYGB_i_bin116]
MAVNLLLLVLAYLWGSLPPGYIAGRLAGIDIRQVGSGSTGATNVLRTLGKGPALVVFAIDLLKGVAAILCARWVWQTWPGWNPGDTRLWWELAYALAALVGHSKSIWINWQGGKSVATGLGLLLLFAWPVALGALAVFVLLVATVRIVSLGSIAACLTASGLALVLPIPLPYQLYVLLGSVYIIWCHRSNIQRLRQGTEPRLGAAKPSGGG